MPSKYDTYTSPLAERNASPEMLRLWSLWRGGGMAPGPLPEAGGIMDQPAIMLEAFAVMTAGEAELRGERAARD